MNPKFIIIDGKTYRSIDEMPPEVRKKYEQAMSGLTDANGNPTDVFKSIDFLGDKNQNGIPDILEDITVGKGLVKSTKIFLDGKEFDSIEDLSPDARQKYEKLLRILMEAREKGDKSKIGTVSIIGNSALGNAPITSTKILIDGKEFNGIEELLSPETRARYEQIMSKLDANQNGIPDFVEALINATNQTANVPTSFGTEAPPSPTFNSSPSAPTSRDEAMPVGPTIEPEPSNSWLLALAGLFGLLLCVVAAAGVWYFFLR